MNDELRMEEIYLNCIYGGFLFSVEVESGEVDGLDGYGEVCGSLFGRKIKEYISDV